MASCGGTYCIVYRYLYSASRGVSKTEALSVHFSSRKKVRLKARERRGKGSREIIRANRRSEVKVGYSNCILLPVKRNLHVANFKFSKTNKNTRSNLATLIQL